MPACWCLVCPARMSQKIVQGCSKCLEGGGQPSCACSVLPHSKHCTLRPFHAGLFALFHVPRCLAVLGCRARALCWQSAFLVSARGGPDLLVQPHLNCVRLGTCPKIYLLVKLLLAKLKPGCCGTAPALQLCRGGSWPAAACLGRVDLRVFLTCSLAMGIGLQ